MLQQTNDPTNPGLWIDTAWPDPGPGTFAVVIGVSRYAHLDGDENRSYGLDQLHVSATSAYAFFQWLQKRYRHGDKPLARCWLLLAPSVAEQAAAVVPSTPLPTFDTCRMAIGQWYASLRSLHPAHAAQSRSVFFFSGHGLEVTQDQQILLPADYLEPPIGNVNRALSTSNLYYGLQQLPVSEHLFFIDACRSDYAKLRETKLQGTPILNEWSTYSAARTLNAPLIYATGPGALAWQPTSPAAGSSVFSQALLEGLAGPPGVPPTTHDGRDWVTLLHLSDYLEPRVRALLQAAGSRAKQPVQISGRWSPRALVCEIQPPRAPRPAAPPPRPPAGAGEPAFLDVDLGVREMEEFEPASFEVAGGPSAPPPADMESLDLGGWAGPSESPNLGHAIGVVGNEFVTQLLWDAQLCNLRTSDRRGLRDDGAREWITIHDIRRDSTRQTYYLDVQLEQDAPTWLELRDRQESVSAACVLLDDGERPSTEPRPVYTLQLDFEASPAGPARIAAFDVVLSEANTAPVDKAAALWNRFRRLDIEQAVRPEEARLLERALEEKLRSPLAATVAALLLLRAWRDDLLHDWLRHLVEWFPRRPDPCVLRTEQLLRARGPDAAAEAVPLLLELERRGLPHTGEALELAVRQVRDLLRFESVPEAERPRLRDLQSRLADALTVFRPGGLCTTFVGRTPLVQPERILALVPAPAEAQAMVERE